jgi:hypothetical protein
MKYLISSLRSPSHLDPGRSLFFACALTEDVRENLISKMNQVKQMEDENINVLGVEFWSDLPGVYFEPVGSAFEQIEDLGEESEVDPYAGGVIEASEDFPSNLEVSDQPPNVDVRTIHARPDHVYIEARLGDLPVEAGEFYRDNIELEKASD